MKATVLGDGGWGTALALVLNQRGHSVRVWCPFPEHARDIHRARENERFLPGVPLPADIAWTAAWDEALSKTDLVVCALPSRYVRETLTRNRGHDLDGAAWVSVTKGLDRERGERMTRLAQRILGQRPVAALSGPSHAEEVARGIPTAVVLACSEENAARCLQTAFTGRSFRVYRTRDVAGVELGGALKNVIALAAGISDGLGYGDNTKAALLTRGLAEMTRLGMAMGGRRRTFAGLSGIGDLVVTCSSRHSRNRATGERLGKGESLQEILNSMQQVAEGVWTCETALALARRHAVPMPITQAVGRVLRAEITPREAVTRLLTRTVGSEDL